MYGGNNPYPPPPQGFDQAGFNPFGSQGRLYQQGPYNPYQQGPYSPQGYQQGPINPKYNQPNPYSSPTTQPYVAPGSQSYSQPPTAQPYGAPTNQSYGQAPTAISPYGAPVTTPPNGSIASAPPPNDTATATAPKSDGVSATITATQHNEVATPAAAPPPYGAPTAAPQPNGAAIPAAPPPPYGDPALATQPNGAPTPAPAVPYGTPATTPKPYGVPTVPQPYGAPAVPLPYGAPTTQPYGQPPTTTYPYGSPVAQPYGAPTQPYGSPAVQSYGAPTTQNLSKSVTTRQGSLIQPQNTYPPVQYNGNPYPQQPPYYGPGEPYLAVQYNSNPSQPPQSPKSQSYNMPAVNSAPVFYQPPTQYYKDHKISSCQGNKKALLIGINYLGKSAQLNGCINDANNMKHFLTTKFGFSDAPGKMIVLTDDQKEKLKRPTRKNMINAMKWLVNDCKPGDSLFFYFSGHGGQAKDLDGDEVDGYDETILPVDFEQSGEIIDDEMNAIMVKPLPEGVRLTALFDSCHSGTALDLPYIYSDDGKLVIQQGPSQVDKLKNTFNSIDSGDILGAIDAAIELGDKKKAKMKAKKAKELTEKTRSSFADVIMLSGCMDSQTSADTRINGVFTGAISYAFIKALTTKRDMNYLELLRETKRYLIEFQQRPQLSTGRLMDMNQKFIM